MTPDFAANHVKFAVLIHFVLYLFNKTKQYILSYKIFNDILFLTFLFKWRAEDN
jgi:hypothetical protein